MTHFPLLLSALMLAPLAAAQTPAGPYVLHGTISDNSDHPLGDVRVGFRSTGASTQSDAKGQFTLKLTPGSPLTKDNTNTYEWLELDKDGYFGRTIKIQDLAFFSKPLHEKLGPNPVTEDRAEFTARMGLDHLLPSISPDKDFALITAERWGKFFAEMDARKQNPEGRTEQVEFQAYIPKDAKKVKAVFLLTRHGIGSIDHPRLRDFANRNGVGSPGTELEFAL